MKARLQWLFDNLFSLAGMDDDIERYCIGVRLGNFA